MKKLLVAMVAMLCLCVVGVAADDTKDADVLYGVTESYDWSIHADINFGTDIADDTVVGIGVDEEDDDAIVSISNNRISHGKKLSISIASTNGFAMKTADNDSIAYTVNKGVSYDASAVLANNGVVLEVAAGIPSGEQALFFQMRTAATQIAGNYSDTLTYTANIIPAN
jgi:hypothetical protein